MITATALTDIGRKRSVNQDYVYASAGKAGNFSGLYILADGMGGYHAGDVASRMLVEIMTGMITKSSQGSVRALRSSIETANKIIYHKGKSEAEFEGMGSTVVAAIAEGNLLTVANVGDSRLYIIRDGLHQVTRDHSLVEQMVRDGELVRGSEEYKAKRHILTRAVGAEDSVDVDIFETELEDGDYVLMCSDGLTNMVDDDRLLSVVTGTGGVRYKAGTLVRMANENGGTDNIAVILFKYTAGGASDDQ